MGEVVFIDVAKKAKSETVQQAWDAYLLARAHAEKSIDITDGIAAGKAWARFLELFGGRSA